MFLHNDKERFEQVVTAVFKDIGYPKAIVEKDYFVTLFLKHLNVHEPLLIFKGGTCLSKCYKLISRFSEDIDINLEKVRSLTQSRRKVLRDHIVETTAELGLTQLNSDAIKSGRDYNNYHIAYPSVFTSPTLKQYLQVETVFRIETFPTQRMKAASLIYDYLKANGRDDLIKQYELEPFVVTAQSLERTFVDKVFALGTYYVNDRIPTHSRHLYDLYKILPHIQIDGYVLSLFDEVRNAWKNRPGSHDGFGAEDADSLSELLREVIDKKVYKHDYETVTAPLLYENVPYADTIETLEEIVAALEDAESEDGSDKKPDTEM
ncbi:hypothetical protein FACS1894211_14680 [Clostridia bacterium]|nr:hypothetical protein FACS1894211_14680 [Clostridia bacterium]